MVPACDVDSGGGGVRLLVVASHHPVAASAFVGRYRWHPHVGHDDIRGLGVDSSEQLRQIGAHADDLDIRLMVKKPAHPSRTRSESSATMTRMSTVGRVAGLIQVAGIIDAAEADMLAECGVDWLGFPLRLTVNKEDLSEEQAAEIIAGIRRLHRGVLITYEVEAREISAFCRRLGVRTVQLHANVPATQLRTLKQSEPDLVVLKSLVVRGDNQQDLAAMVDETCEWVDMYITDTFNPVTGADGATGLVHDWTISADLVQHSPRPVMLAGGLTPDNVGTAIRTVRPAAVDAHTGLEDAAGRKDPAKVQRFVAHARRAFAQLSAPLKAP